MGKIFVFCRIKLKFCSWLYKKRWHTSWKFQLEIRSTKKVIAKKPLTNLYEMNSRPWILKNTSSREPVCNITFVILLSMFCIILSILQHIMLYLDHDINLSSPIWQCEGLCNHLLVGTWVSFSVSIANLVKPLHARPFVRHCVCCCFEASQGP